MDEVEYDPLTPDEERSIYSRQLYRILIEEGLSQNLITFDQVMHVETQHLILSYALGKPIGLIKTQHENEDIQSLSGILENRVLQIESIID